MEAGHLRAQSVIVIDKQDIENISITEGVMSERN
jgi:voltage-gated potassium channel Kch